MYEIVQATRKTKIVAHDYLYEKFSDMYEQAKCLTLSWNGKYSIVIKTDDIKDIVGFMRQQDKYMDFVITIYSSKATVDYIASNYVNAVIAGAQSPYELFKSLVMAKNVLFEKKVMPILYNSIEHDEMSMDNALNVIISEYGAYNLITEVMLSKFFVLNKSTYPRSVVINFIYMGRYRWYKLEKCIDEMGNDVVVGAMVKNIKLFVEEKAVYFRTGKGSNFIKSLNTQNLNRLYQIFVAERNGINDAILLLAMYERGLGYYDIVQQRRD